MKERRGLQWVLLLSSTPPHRRGRAGESSKGKELCMRRDEVNPISSGYHPQLLAVDGQASEHSLNQTRFPRS